ncbi:hypothetical protein ACH4TV_44990 [Streptomyces sp. NPDC020898]|uniref:hypothetical protein n=1 Tax=Streptomyces sp. NPDC020898 TaxID=3365101 RepID=UPI0037B9F05F
MGRRSGGLQRFRQLQQLGERHVVRVEYFLRRELVLRGRVLLLRGRRRRMRWRQLTRGS